MADRPEGASRDPGGGLLRKVFRYPLLVYSAILFAVAVTALGFAITRVGILPESAGPGLVAFFIAYSLFTIFMGYMHPRVGYVSFDRIAQVGSILVLGPVAAAWISGVASFLYPWHRLWGGRSFIDVLTAALHNAGLMSLMVLVCGLVYQRIGGAVPLASIGLVDVATLLLLLLGMQTLNDVGMRIFLTLAEHRAATAFSPFAFIVESGAGLGGILVALVMNRMEPSAVGLLLLVMTLGMISLMELARIRTRLEARVEKRTRELQAKTRELELIATHDPLTGLHNRRYADEYLEERLGEFERYRLDFAIALVDLDHFKRINDDFSHDAGDEVLKAVATIFRMNCRDTDVIARYGGEEFLLCFPQARMEAAREACEKIRVAVATHDWDSVVPGVVVTLSAGIAAMRPGLSRRELLGAADQALYAAKSAGRNCSCIAVEKMRAAGFVQR
ncbi:GGDEF domain-containing protein [Wenzhouxiangella sp. XN24]|uniref:GGDEF domain-containing protein n=1 Tax=Wenzhouxiangella sp. XN24 TaxID=2713569 RepID=UPI0013EA1078|nr:GGDEF domain-containing protein [Wenzhouxiangella sp. XN24]NGX15107.1 GGDEF domain-containing protein [Wenzhouxiangella sp. XN24]